MIFIRKILKILNHFLNHYSSKVGGKVVDVKVGDGVGAGVLSDSCMECKYCKMGEENACEKGFTRTYNAEPVHGHIKTGAGWTQGGYSGSMTMHRRYIVRVPHGYPLEMTGPILCAGIHPAQCGVACKICHC